MGVYIYGIRNARKPESTEDKTRLSRKLHAAESYFSGVVFFTLGIPWCALHVPKGRLQALPPRRHNPLRSGLVLFDTRCGLLQKPVAPMLGQVESDGLDDGGPSKIEDDSNRLFSIRFFSHNCDEIIKC